MAQLTPPTWTGPGGSVRIVSLPSITLVTTRVRSSQNHSGFVIEYLLRSSRLQFVPDRPTQNVLTAEHEQSSPSFTPIRRDPRVIVDRYSPKALFTDVVRALAIQSTGQGAPVAATLTLSVFDLTATGTRTNAAEDSVQVSFSV